MTRTRPASVARLATVDRKTARRHEQRQRHQARELAEALRERHAREALPVNDCAPLPRID